MIERHRTAMARSFLSRPMQLALEDGLLNDATVFDYGCGRGDDVRLLQELGVDAAGWDPAFAPDTPRKPTDVVNIGYVVNVVEDPVERSAALQEAWRLAADVLIVAARLDWEARGLTNVIRHGDGVLTTAGTFQRFYRHEELRSWIDQTLGVSSVAGAPGIFYVFRHRDRLQAFLARRARQDVLRSRVCVAAILFERHRHLLEPLRRWIEEIRRLPTPGEFPTERDIVDALGSIRAAFALIRRATGPQLWSDIDLGQRIRVIERRFHQHRDLLDPLIDFVSQRGRLPRHEELPNGNDVAAEFGSVRAAFSLVRRVTGTKQWAEVEERSRRDFLVYLAFAAFGGRPRFTELPEDLRYDVRDLFGNYKAACQQADELLFAAGNAKAINLACRSLLVGKLTPEALYVHTTALGSLPPVLRVYEGCGRALTGTVTGATVLKLHCLRAQVSYLEYPGFDREAHPALSTVVVARLSKLDVTFKDFRASENPPILHRKETFVPEDYPGREKFARLTAQEERLGLLDDSVGIGTREGWKRRLEQAEVGLLGHRVVKSKSQRS
jgi:hypothetical protein